MQSILSAQRALIDHEKKEQQTLSIKEIRADIEERALERQVKIQRGEIDVPIHYFPVSVATMYDRLAQLDYRVDFLSLAVPPPEASFLGRMKVAAKSFVCRALRWLMIRQVEFNTVCLDQALESARLHAANDQNIGELYAAVKAMKLQVNTLAQRIARLEDENQAVASDPLAPAGGLNLFTQPQSFPDDDEEEKPPVTAGYFAGRGPILNIGCGRGDFLKVLLSEGIDVQGIDADRRRVDDLQDRELPVTCEQAGDYLSHLADGLLVGVFLNHVFTEPTPHQIGELLARSWQKLKKGGVLIIETSNPACHANAGDCPSLSVDLLGYLLESQCFALVDQVFSGPIRAGLPRLVQSSTGDAYDMKLFRNYALVGRK